MNQLRQVQQKELHILKDFIAICEELDLSYYALGGTMLGAVRHGGFIPWDDDIDLGMPRKDYEVFVKRAPEFFDPRYQLIENPANLNILQIVDTSTKIEIGKRTSGIFIDVFPLDGYPDNRVVAYWHNKRVLFYRMLAKLSMLDVLVERDRGFVENTIVTVAKTTHFNKLLNPKKVTKKLHRMIQKYDYHTSKQSGNVLGRYRDREVMPYDIMGTPKPITFEGIEITGPANPDEYLTRLYGDYMTLPPKDKQIAHEIKIISLGE